MPVCVNHFVDRVRKTRSVVGFGLVRVTQDRFKKSISDFEEVSTVGPGVCGALGVLCQVADELWWDEEPYVGSQLESARMTSFEAFLHTNAFSTHHPLFVMGE